LSPKGKVLFRVDATPEIGTGHFYRCLSLAAMICSEFDVCFGMATEDVKIKTILETRGFHLIKLADFNYKPPDDRDDSEEIPFDLEDHLHMVDLVVLDGYWFGRHYQEALRAFEAKIVVIEDHGGGHFFADLIVNVAAGLKPEDYTSDNQQVVKALGPSFALLREGFLQKAQEKNHSTNKLIERVFVCFGGSDFYNKTLEVSKWILINSKMNVHAVLGDGYSYMNLMNGLAEDFQGRVNISKGLNEIDMIQVIDQSTLGVVPSSGVLFECIACRLPVISGLYTNNQEQIYRGLVDEFVFLPAEDFSNEHLSKAWGMFTPDTEKLMIKNQERLIDGKSAERFRTLFKSLC